jgi:hypothetical protein
MNNFKSHLVKYSAPTKWDPAPYTTIWRIKNDADADLIFMQMSEDWENPNWIPMADIMVKAFNRFYTDATFIDECIALYKEDISKSACHTIKFVK